MHKYTSVRLMIVLFALVALVVPAAAERGDDSDRKSKNGQTMATVDGVEVTLEYGRPNVKGREIWGGLEPYDEVWRTGANEATTIELSADVHVEGKKLAAGRYGLFTIPTKADWTVIFNKVAEQWGDYDYDQGQDALRVTVTPRAIEHVEEMDFVIEGSTVMLRWGTVGVAFEIAAAE